MPRLSRICCLAVVAACSIELAARAEDGPRPDARDCARRALERAKIELRLYVQVEYPREQRRLDAQIELTRAQIDVYRQRLRDCRPFDRFSTGGALTGPIQDLKLCLLEAELRLNDLQAERDALVRFHSDQWRLLELRVYEARVRLAELEHAAEQAGPPVPEPSA
jgi:hypothetical protein